MKIFFILQMMLASLLVSAETVILHYDNGEGGIRKLKGNLVVEDGQYYVNFSVRGYGNTVNKKHLKVYRVKDEADVWFDQPVWAEKYAYAASESSGVLSSKYYYFNMTSKWRPSLTQSPNAIKPLKKINVYYDPMNGGIAKRRVILIWHDGAYELYTGDPFFLSIVYTNNPPLDYAPVWSRKYQYRAKVEGFDVYFNIDNSDSTKLNYKQVLNNLKRR